MDNRTVVNRRPQPPAAAADYHAGLIAAAAKEARRSRPTHEPTRLMRNLNDIILPAVQAVSRDKPRRLTATIA